MASADTYTSQTGHTYVTVNGAWCLSVASPADTLAIDTTAVCVRIHPDSLLTEAVLDAAGFTTTDVLVDSLYGGWYAVTVPPGSDCFAHLDSLESWPLIEWARFDIPFQTYGPPNPDDTYFHLQWGFQDSMTALPSAWDIQTALATLKVAVVDDGLQSAHGDLPEVEYLLAPGTQSFPVMFHGTAVTGILAAVTNNAKGVAGVAHGAHVHFMQGLTESTFGAVFVALADLGVRVINCSVGDTGGPDDFPMISTQIDSLMAFANDGKGIAIVCAAGQQDGEHLGVLAFPASHPKTIAVGGMESNRVRQQGHTNTSGVGAHIDLLGPGGYPVPNEQEKRIGSIVTTDLLGADGQNLGDYTLEGEFGGTSAASPFVAGVAALALSANPDLTWDQVQAILRHSATKLPGMTGYFDISHGYGLVNALGAVVGAKYNARPIEGVISQSMTLPDTSYGNPFTNLYLTGDLKIAEGCTLTVSAGTKIYAAVQDSANLGVDSYKVEIVVDGVLVTQGTASDSVEFLCAGGGEGSWYGISLFSGTGSLDLNYTRITNGVYGLVSSSYENVWVKNCYFAENENIDIKIGGVPDSVLVKDCFIDVGGGTGINLQSGAHNVTLEADTLQGELSVSSNGILIEGPNATIRNCLISDFKTFGNGVSISSGGPVISGGEIRNCRSGVSITGGTPFIGGSSASDGSLFLENRFGIESDCAGPGTCPSCSSFAPIVRRATFDTNINGVLVTSRGFIDLGTNISPGNCAFIGTSSRAIWNQDNCDTVSASGNWFGSPVVVVEGDVDTTGSLPAPPSFLDSPYVRLKKQAFLSPVRSPVAIGTTAHVRFSAPTHDSLRLVIYAVTGRQVRSLRIGRVNGGEGIVDWDIKDDTGRSVPSGIYFISLESKSQRLTTSRIVVLPRGGS